MPAMPARSRIPTRRKPCKICRLPASELELLEAGLAFSWSPRSLAARFGTVTRKNVVFHARNCIATEEKEEE
jgi:hypothetical protein